MQATDIIKYTTNKINAFSLGRLFLFVTTHYNMNKKVHLKHEPSEYLQMYNLKCQYLALFNHCIYNGQIKLKCKQPSQIFRPRKTFAIMKLVADTMNYTIKEGTITFSMNRRRKASIFKNSATEHMTVGIRNIITSNRNIFFNLK
jgi:hypothetical protein